MKLRVLVNARQELEVEARKAQAIRAVQSHLETTSRDANVVVQAWQGKWRDVTLRDVEEMQEA